MYARKVNDQELNFSVSGMLWRRSLIMIDRETKSLWSHLLGKAMDGTLKGTTLETLPGVITTWKAWKEAQPKTSVLVMSRTAREFVKEFHEQPGRFVLGLRLLHRAKAYPFEALIAQPVINDTFGEDAVLLVYDPDGTGGRAFDRRVKVKNEDRTLQFERGKGKLTDRETRSVWSEEGRCVEGVLKGIELRELPAIPSFAKAWKQFYPETEIYKLPK